MNDGVTPSRMNRIKGARHAHAAMRAQGRTPGDEGRAVIAANHAARRELVKLGKQGRYGNTLDN
jgi:hypothetical protein